MITDEVHAQLSADILDAIIRSIGIEPAQLHEPSFDGKELTYLRDCVDSTFVSSVGQYVDRFEKRIAEYTNSRFVVSTVSGTSALHVALILAGVKPDDEVLVPALTFVATANAVRYCGAFPHFVDSEQETLGIAVDDLREYLNSTTEIKSGDLYNRITGRRIKAIIPMHTFGHATKMDGVLDLANQFNLEVVEDAAESLGSLFRDQHTGTFGKLGILSFNGNKIITTGGGGAILTDDEDLAKQAKHITTTAKINHRWEFEHDQVGFNYRMPNLNAALGCAQLEHIEEKVSQKRRLFEAYSEAFASVNGATLYQERRECRSNYWLQTVLLDKPSFEALTQTLELLNDHGFMSRPSWKPISDLAPYRKSPSMPLKNAKELSLRIINIPSSPALASRII